jgi:hypothetical protein
LIESHTVPQSLLERFAYHDPYTDSLRLWRYAKDRPPYKKQSPKSATRYGGHFSDPENAAAEAEIEQRLAQEFETPVNQFVHLLGDPGFIRTDERRLQLTRYVTLLFLRSKSRRQGTKHIQDVKHRALDRFLSNESQLLTVATNWNIDLICRGLPISSPITKEDVAAKAREYFERLADNDAEQQQYMVGIQIGMANLDEPMYQGDWNLLTTTSDRPFIVSDSPVVTWQRDATGTIYHGGGFHRPNVEILLPVSPTSCLHILPAVERTQPVIVPTVDQVNIAQVAFAYRDCFANIYAPEIDALVQQYISTARIGENVFTVWHRNYDNMIYDILMNRGRWVEPPSR